MDASADLGAMHRQLARLRLGLVVLGLLWLATFAWLALRPTKIPPVLSVERLEVLEPDGSPAFVLANSRRPAVATVDGKVVMAGQEEERRVPSFIFFDGKGDEVGGMLFGNYEAPNGRGAVRHLSLDALGQDQTVVLQHDQDARGSTSGLAISDRPTQSMLDSFKDLGLEPGATRAELTAAIERIPDAERGRRTRELFGGRRAFFGTVRSGESRVELRDGEGRVRVSIEAPADGAASIRLLDESGAEVLRLP
jgi:hypothetical protein